MNSACPYLRLLAKDSSGLLTRNIKVLSNHCPHLKATGITPNEVVEELSNTIKTTTLPFTSLNKEQSNTVNNNTNTHTIIPPCMNKGKHSLASPCSGKFNNTTYHI